MNDENTIEQRHSGRHKSSALPAGTAAPDFTLRSTPDQSVNLSDFRSQPVVIDPEGLIHWSHVSPVGVNPGAEGILAALEELHNKREAT